MTIDLTGLVRPHLVEMTKRDDNPNAAEFRLQPLERGFGYTLGNSLRRLLLSSLRGTAVWGFRLDGVVHEHQTVQGVLEDVHQVVQRLKSLTLVLAEDVDEAILHIRREGAGPVYARDIQEHGSVVVKNPDHLLFTLQDDREVSMELYVNKGRGYVEAEMHPADRSLPVDLVRIDAIYNPVRSANFAVAETRVGQRTTTTGSRSRSRPTGRSPRKTPSPTRPRSPRSTSSTSWTSARCPRCGMPVRPRPRWAVPTSASVWPGRSTTSVSRSARSIP
jgi:DNA-directed RNA polymerase subunit alpha